MNIKQSMISIVAASLLIASFTGCSDGDKTTSLNTEVNTIESNSYTAPVKGLVIDDAGNPVAGAIVYIGSKSATTNAGGQYQINGVDVSSYLTNQTGSVSVVGSQDDINEQLLTVSIVPPSKSGLTSAVVQVNPEMVHIENIGEDELSEGVATTATTGDVYTQPNSESFTLISEAGTAMLSYKTAKVTGILRDSTTGEIIPDTTIVVSYTGVSSNVSAWVMSDNIVTGVNSIVSKTDENGSFLLEELLTSSNYVFIVEGYTGIGTGDGINTDASALYADGGYVTDTANVLVTKILSDDTISPYIDLQSNSELTPYLANAHPTDFGETMIVFAEGIDGTAGNEFLINFTEVIDTTKLVDESVIVYDRTNSVEINATVVFINNGKTLQLTTPSVSEDTILEFRLRRSDFTDEQGNILHTAGGAIDTSAGPTDSKITSEIQAALSDQFIILNASTYKQVSMNLATVVSSGQNAGTVEDLTNNSYSNAALNTVSEYSRGTTTVINQMNAANAVSGDLLDLATQLDGTIATLNTNVATITFTADPNVTTYWARVVNANGADISAARITQVTGSDIGAGDAIVPTTALATNNPLIAAAAGDNASELKNVDTIVTTFLIDLNQDLTEGDNVEIYPVNDFGDTGTPTVVVLTDNTPLTTVINGDLVAGSTTVDVVAAGAPSSAGGDLIDFNNASGTALPYLFVRADMYKATDDALIADKNLQAELTGADDIYDAADFTSFLSTIPRTIAIQISEPVASSTILATALKVYDNANAMVPSIITAAQSGTAVGGEEVIGATIANIFNLQDYNTISLEGIADAAGNVAGAQAGVKLYDALPPLMTASTVSDESVTFAFTEDISLIQTEAGIAQFITLSGDGANIYTFITDVDGVMTVSKNATHTDFNSQLVPANTALETTTTNISGVVTITLTGNDSTGTPTNVNLSTYFSDIHGTKDAAGDDNAKATGSSLATFINVPDTSTSAAGVDGTNNSWANAIDNLTVVPQFAVTDTITPRLATAAAAINPATTATSQQFVHAIDITNAALFNVSGAVAPDNDWVPGETSDVYTIELNFREDISDGAEFFGSPVTTVTAGTYTTGTVTPSLGNTGLTLTFNSDAIVATAINDAITITGIEDASGNTTTVVITLEDTDKGISINTAAVQ